MDILIELFKLAIFLIMVGVTFSSVYLSLRLRRLINPLSIMLAHLHNDTGDFCGERLFRIRERYEKLLKHVDNVDASEFSAGVIETERLYLFSIEMTAAAAQSWLRQAPGILISLGLLGTFAGLAVGLSEITGVLANSPASEVNGAVKAIVAPMGAAFQLSFLGLFFSLFVLIFTQISGTRDCLDRCELLLASWLETILAPQLGDKILTPLRKSIQNLNDSVQDLPKTISLSIETAMKVAFSSKLDEIFNVNSRLIAEASRSVGQLSAVASALNESGQDFVEAAQAFRDSDFASTLATSVQQLQESSDELANSTGSLSSRLVDVRDGLMHTQLEWKLLAKTAEQELESCRIASQQIQEEIKVLREASNCLALSTQSTTDAAKQLKEVRLEVMRDRKLALELAESVQIRLAADTSVAESCQVFASALEIALNNWNRNVERLDELTTAFVTSVQHAKLEDEQVLAERSKAASETMDQLSSQLKQDLGDAIKGQHEAIIKLSEPTRYAQSVSQKLINQLNELELRLANLTALKIQDPDASERGL